METCKECGAFADLDDKGICRICRKVERQITRSYQRREEYRDICPECGKPLMATRDGYVCHFCGKTPEAPAYDHKNATKNPPLGIPECNGQRPTLRDIASLYKIPRGRRR